MGDHGIPMVVRGMAMVARAIDMDDHGLPRTPMAFPLVTMLISMGDRGIAMIERGIATDGHG